ncbi:hypothetical protein BKA63DRAFT_579719, partial [Paraphoma chrysanthemicola]
MGRVYRHFLATLPLLGVVAGGSRVIRAAPPYPSNIINTLGKTIGAARIGITSLFDGLLDVTLDAVDDILTIIGLLTSAPLTVLDPLILALEQPHPRDPRTRGWQYFGCFDPDVYLGSKATLKSGLVNGAMGAKICIDLCIADLKDYATVQGGLCYCAIEPPRADTCTDRCNLPCPLNTDQFCEGSGSPLVAAITVYKRVVSTLAMPKPAYPARWVYNGCFYLQAWLSLLNPANSYSETPVGGTDDARCSALCSGKNDSYTTAAISDRTCYCSSLAIGASLLAGDGECAR